MNNKDSLRKRYWLLQNMEWFLDECAYYRDNRFNFNDNKIVLWVLNSQEGKVVIK